MTLSRFIQQLTELQRERGDIDVLKERRSLTLCGEERFFYEEPEAAVVIHPRAITARPVVVLIR